MGAAWLCLHLWEHYRFGLNLSFLKERAYPVMKEAALFLLDYMVEEGGVRITGPSVSLKTASFFRTEAAAASVWDHLWICKSHMQCFPPVRKRH